LSQDRPDGEEDLTGRIRGIVLARQLGPGLITGAADDDPSGIATYSQAGAQFGNGLLWTMVLTYAPVPMREAAPQDLPGASRWV
jgi:hypothetical protein